MKYKLSNTCVQSWTEVLTSARNPGVSHFFLYFGSIFNAELALVEYICEVVM